MENRREMSLWTMLVIATIMTGVAFQNLRFIVLTIVVVFVVLPFCKWFFFNRKSN